VRFLRLANNEINSQIAGKDTFKLLSKSAVFPRTMCYAKAPYGKQLYKYVYHQPVSATGGLPTGALKGTGLDPALLSEMTGKIANGTYSNVHSVLIVKSRKLFFKNIFTSIPQIAYTNYAQLLKVLFRRLLVWLFKRLYQK